MHWQSPPPGLESLSGYIDFYGGGDWWRWDPPGATPLLTGNDWLFGGNARINDWITPSYSVQLDIDGEMGSRPRGLTAFFTGGSAVSQSGDGSTNIDIAAHGAWRDPNVGALGLFGVIAKSTDITYYGGSFIEGLIGAEGQYYLGNLTLYAQGGYMGTLDNNKAYGIAIAPENTWFIRGVGRYYVTPNDKLQAEVGFAQSGPVCFDGICADGTASPSYSTWGAKYEHRFTGTMWSAFVEYDGFRVDGSSVLNGGASPVTTNLVMGGIKLNFGHSTIMAEERQGVAFDVPTFLRALNWTTLGGGLY